MKYSFALAALIVGTAEAGDPISAVKLGWCPWNVFNMPPAVGDFKPERYAGTWYEIWRDKDLWYEQDQSCVTATYTYDKDFWFYPVGVNN